MTGDVLKSISAWSIIIPIVVGLYYFRLFDANSRIMFALILLAGIPQLAAVIFSDKKYGADINFLYNFYALLDPLAWAILFFRNIKNKKLRKVVAIISLVQVIFWIALLNAINAYTEVFKEMICLTSIVQVLWIAVYFYEQYKSYEISRIETKPMFWFCIAILIYAPATYFLFVFFDQIHSEESPDHYLWNIHSVLNTLLYCIISIGFWMNKRNEFIFS